MVAPNPETIANELFESIYLLLLKNSYLQKDDLEVRRLFKRTDQLMESNVPAAHLAKANLHFLIKDYEAGQYHIKVANQWYGEHKHSTLYNTVITLSRYSFYPEAQRYFNVIVDQILLEPFELVKAGFNCLAFSSLNDLILKAQKLDLTFDSADEALAKKAYAILKAANITDDDVAKYAQIFGNVFHEASVITSSEHPLIKIADKENNWSPPTVFIIFILNESTEVISKVYKESVKRIIKEYGTIPDALHFSVESSE